MIWDLYHEVGHTNPAAHEARQKTPHPMGLLLALFTHAGHILDWSMACQRVLTQVSNEDARAKHSNLSRPGAMRMNHRRLRHEPRSENLGNRERCPTSGSSVPFGIDDAFTTTDGEYHRAFRRRVELLLKINDERWTHLARRATELAPVGVANLYPRPRSCRDISRSLGTEDGAQIQHVHPALRPRGLARLTTTTMTTTTMTTTTTSS